VKNWFQTFAFQCNLYRSAEAKRHEAAESPATRVARMKELGLASTWGYAVALT
jgi:hypothetical protein